MERLLVTRNYSCADIKRSREFIQICANNETERAIQFLTIPGINLREVDIRGRTALMHACALGNIGVVTAILKMPFVYVGIIARRADWPFTRNALTYAIRSGSIQCAKAVMEHEVKAHKHPIIFRSTSNYCIEYLEVLIRSDLDNTNILGLAQLLLKYANSRFFKCSCCGIRSYHSALIINALEMPSCEFIDLLIDNLIDISTVHTLLVNTSIDTIKHVATRGLRVSFNDPNSFCSTDFLYKSVYKEWDTTPRSLKYCTQVLIMKTGQRDTVRHSLLMMPNSYRKELNFLN